MKELPYHLIGSKRCGSALAEIFLKLAGIPFTIEELPWEKRETWVSFLKDTNQISQVPTLIIGDNKVLTESLGIAVHCNEKGAGIIPTGENHVMFWQWALFIVANIYPTFHYFDNMETIARLNEEIEYSKEKILKKRKKYWLILEEKSARDWFLGNQYTAIDIYISVMINWQPGHEWFRVNCPKLFKIYENVLKKDIEGNVIKRHFAD